MRLTICDACSGTIVSEPFITSTPGMYFFTCSAVCRDKIEGDIERERRHQHVLALNDRAMSLGQKCWNGA